MRNKNCLESIRPPVEAATAVMGRTKKKKVGAETGIILLKSSYSSSSGQNEANGIRLRAGGN
jgi:hypothetical protein